MKLVIAIVTNHNTENCFVSSRGIVELAETFILLRHTLLMCRLYYALIFQAYSNKTLLRNSIGSWVLKKCVAVFQYHYVNEVNIKVLFVDTDTVNNPRKNVAKV